MQIGLDVGYSAVKVASGDKRITFPSVVGTPDKARFSLDSRNGIILTEPSKVLVGQGAIEQSRYTDRREDRSWITSDAYYSLTLAAFSELSEGTFVELRIVTGLPVAFFEADKAILRARLMGDHRLTRESRRGQTFKVTDCRVIPQPFGCLLSAVLDDKGNIVDNDLATGAVGIIDVGGKTTNLLSVNRLSEISRETASLDKGSWDVVRAFDNYLSIHCPDLTLRDHEIMGAIIARKVWYYDEPVDLSGEVEAQIEPMAKEIIAKASQLWNGGAGLRGILVSGGGALLVGDHIKRHFRHARVVEEPVFANALGYWKFAQRVAGL